MESVAYFVPLRVGQGEICVWKYGGITRQLPLVHAAYRVSVFLSVRHRSANVRAPGSSVS